jgi:hypothetical protein
LKKSKIKNEEIKTPIIIFTAVKDGMDYEKEYDGRTVSPFFYYISKVLNDRKFKGGYKELFKEISKYSNRDRSVSTRVKPQYIVTGKTSEEFEEQQPFTI